MAWALGAGVPKGSDMPDFYNGHRVLMPHSLYLHGTWMQIPDIRSLDVIYSVECQRQVSTHYSHAPAQNHHQNKDIKVRSRREMFSRSADIYFSSSFAIYCQ